MTGEKWYALSLAQQLGNVGSDYERALRWKEKKQLHLFQNAVARTLEQLDLTLTNPHLSLPRRREIARVRDEVCHELLENSETSTSAQGLQKYFLAMATLARHSNSHA